MTVVLVFTEAAAVVEDVLVVGIADVVDCAVVQDPTEAAIQTSPLPQCNCPPTTSTTLPCCSSRWFAVVNLLFEIITSDCKTLLLTINLLSSMRNAFPLGS
eukprot:CAMPEP_0172861310 /NCGR_PEP_ID=MMETSP1075-20121228/72586_1 /TAXON_ID=2916 /ORGANISM="Ceratium fusus, Strain PA161109" /LENGTH=100 /DNA_ID=CAMNT_0013709437 /DNA_START=17 /DNA_END=319 /DNA_ORIENTATION=+